MNDRQLGALIAKAHDLEQAAKQAAAAYDKARGDLAKELQRRGIKSITLGGYTGTLVEPVETRYIEEYFAAKLTPRHWEAVTDRKLNPAKLSALVQAGAIKPRLVARGTEEVPKKPYARATRAAS